jgi:hypothetical protein
MLIKSSNWPIRRHPERKRIQIFDILQKILNWWSKRDGTDKTITISVILGGLLSAFLIIYLISINEVDIVPYTDNELQRLYNQIELVSKENTSYDDLYDFNSQVDYYEDCYATNYSNKQVGISIYKYYNGDTLKQVILDKKESVFTGVMKYIKWSIFTWIFLFIIIMIILTVFRVVWRYILDKVRIKSIKSLNTFPLL